MALYLAGQYGHKCMQRFAVKTWVGDRILSLHRETRWVTISLSLIRLRTLSLSTDEFESWWLLTLMKNLRLSDVVYMHAWSEHDKSAITGIFPPRWKSLTGFSIWLPPSTSWSTPEYGRASFFGVHPERYTYCTQYPPSLTSMFPRTARFQIVISGLPLQGANGIP